MPLLRALNAHFFEPGDPKNNDFWKVDEGDEKRWRAAGLAGRRRAKRQGRIRRNITIPARPRGRCCRRSRPGPTARTLIRYINPETGGAVMPTLDCYAMRLPKNVETRAKARRLYR